VNWRGWASALAAVAFAVSAAAQEPDRMLTARAGEALIPPREYGYSDGAIDPERHNPIESGKIYDIAYAGIVRGRMQFEYRGYSIADLANPAFSQREERPLATRRVQIRDIVLTIVKAEANRLRYSWSYEKGASDLLLSPPLADSDPGPAIEIKEP
jgi:hypothetical protein